MMMTRSATLQAVICTIRFLGLQQQDAITGVEGHAFLMAPVSRTFYYTPVFQESGFPNMEYCPHCMQSRGPAAVRARAEELTDPAELALYGGGRWPHFDAYERGELASNGNYYETDAISVRHGICGDPGQTKAEGENLYAQDNSLYPVLETFAEGAIVEMKVVMSTWHWGHLEFFICNANDLADGPDSPVTQGCFNMYPLDRAADDGDASPIDPNYSGRYYVDPPCRAAETDQSKPTGTATGDVVTARYQLPEGLTCERCIIQMVYYTGNSCHHPGYAEFNPPSWPSECAPSKSDWITLDPGMCGEGDKYPEEFWNCADIQITSSGSPGGPSPVPETTEPVAEPTAEPVAEPTAEPVAEPTAEPVAEPTAAEPTPTPTPVAEPEPETPEPTNAPETTEPFGGGAPTPMVSAPPATFAPVVPEEELCNGDDVIEDYGQCGGTDYKGSSCCGHGFTCEAMSDCYFECRPSPAAAEECSEGWGQCGGKLWDGPICCMEGAVCVERSEWYSQCIPDNTNL